MSNQPLFFVYFSAMFQEDAKYFKRFSIEYQLICALCNSILNQQKLHWDKPVDYSKLKKQISLNNLSTFFWKHFSDFPILFPIEEFLQKSAKKSIVNHLKLKVELLKLIDILNQNEINFTLFKGHYLIEKIYEVNNIRTSTDIDILISPKDLLQVKTILLEQNYKLLIPQYDLPENKMDLFMHIENEIPFKSPNNVLIDLHFNLFANPYLLNTSNWSSFETNYEGRKIHVFKLTQVFVYLVIHGKKHSWSRLKWLLDIVQFYNIFNEEDWQEVDEIICANKLNDIFTETLVLCKLILGKNIPERYQNKKVFNSFKITLHKVLIEEATKNRLIGNFRSVFFKKSWNYAWFQILKFPARDLYYVNIPFFAKYLHPLFRPFIYIFIIRKSK